MLTESEENRFWAKVKKGKTCWLWTAGKFTFGYGKFKLRGRTLGAHRISYELVNGRIPDGLELDHLCRTPACVNPAHLEPVTSGENTRRGLSPGNKWTQGGRNGSVKLTKTQVVQIRSDQRPQTEIAAAYGISQSQVSHIKTGKRWGHV